MALKLTQNQIPDHSILDINGKQTYNGNSFIASTPSNLVVGTTEAPMMLITNPASNKVSMFNFSKKFSCMSAGSTVIFRVYINPTITTNGTAILPQNLRFNTASPASVMAVFSSPTVSANGTFVGALPVGAFATAISTILQILDPGQSLLVTAQGGIAATSVEIEKFWYEL